MSISNYINDFGKVHYYIHKTLFAMFAYILIIIISMFTDGIKILTNIIRRFNDYNIVPTFYFFI